MKPPQVGEYYGDPLANVFKIESVDGDYAMVSKVAGLGIMPESGQCRFHISTVLIMPKVEWPARVVAGVPGSGRLKCYECGGQWKPGSDECHTVNCKSRLA